MGEIPQSAWSWINEAADRFERAWKSGPRPRIEDFLAEVAAPRRGPLLDELLRVECELRGRAGETPTALEYLRRFPEHADVVAALLDPEATRSVRPGGPEAAGAARAQAGPSPQADTIPPELTGHPDYQIIRLLGSGGMGRVYLAHNRITGREEVLKVISRDIDDMPAALDRFLREIRAVARLQHPNIVTAYSAFRAGGSLVLAMEHVEGRDLSRLVQAKGPLSVSHACYFVHQAALGLQHAHEAGVVHRDIKPSNIMFARAGDRAIIKVLDFGLARASRELGMSDPNRSRVGPDPHASGHLTRAGEMIGTPAFIAPEQIADAPSADIRADIYSLGCTLYYLLSGRPPFRGPTLYDILRGHRSAEPPSLNLERPEVPGELTAVVTRMMAKEPDRRFQTPADVAAALAPFFRKSMEAAAGEASESDRAPARAPDPSAVAAATAPRPAAAPGDREPAWGNLIDFKQADEPDDPGAGRGRGAGDAGHSRWLRPLVAAGALSLGLVAACWSAGVFKARSTLPVANRPVTVASGGPRGEGSSAGRSEPPARSNRGSDRPEEIAVPKPSPPEAPADPKPTASAGAQPAEAEHAPPVPASPVIAASKDRPAEPSPKASPPALVGSPRWRWIHDAYLDEFNTWVETCRAHGYRPVFVNGHNDLEPQFRLGTFSDARGKVRFAAIAVKDGRRLPFVVRLERGFANYNLAFEEMTSKGYHLSTQTIFTDGLPCGLAVYTATKSYIPFEYLYNSDFDDYFRNLTRIGRHPVSISTRPSGNSWQAAVATRSDPNTEWRVYRELGMADLERTLREARVATDKAKRSRPEILFHCPTSSNTRNFGVILTRDNPDLLWEVLPSLSPRELESETRRRAARGLVPDQVVGYAVEAESRYLACWTRDPHHYPATGFGDASVDAADEALERFLIERRVPRATFSVFRKESLLLARGYGHSDPMSQEPTSPDDGAKLGALASPFAAAALHSLILKRKLREEDRLIDLIQAPEGEPLAETVGELLSRVDGTGRESGAATGVWLGRVLEAKTSKSPSEVVVAELNQRLKLKADRNAPKGLEGIASLAVTATALGQFFLKHQFDGRPIPAKARPPDATFLGRDGSTLALVLRREEWLLVALLGLRDDAPPTVGDDLRLCLDLAVGTLRTPPPADAPPLPKGRPAPGAAPAVAAAGGQAGAPQEPGVTADSLRWAGQFYILRDEDEVSKAMDTFRKRLNEANLATDRLRELERTTQAALTELELLTIKKNELSQMHATLSLTDQRLANQRMSLSQQQGAGLATEIGRTRTEMVQISASIAGVNRTSNALRAQATAASADAERFRATELLRRKEAEEALSDVRRRVDETIRRYTALEKDDAVQKTLTERNRESKIKYKLGPSLVFHQIVVELEKRKKASAEKPRNAPRAGEPPRRNPSDKPGT